MSQRRSRQRRKKSLAGSTSAKDYAHLWYFGAGAAGAALLASVAKGGGPLAGLGASPADESVIWPRTPESDAIAAQMVAAYQAKEDGVLSEEQAAQAIAPLLGERVFASLDPRFPLFPATLQGAVRRK